MDSLDNSEPVAALVEVSEYCDRVELEPVLEVLVTVFGGPCSGTASSPNYPWLHQSWMLRSFERQGMWIVNQALVDSKFFASHPIFF